MQTYNIVFNPYSRGYTVEVVTGARKQVVGGYVTYAAALADAKRFAVEYEESYTRLVNKDIDEAKIVEVGGVKLSVRRARQLLADARLDAERSDARLADARAISAALRGEPHTISAERVQGLVEEFVSRLQKWGIDG